MPMRSTLRATLLLVTALLVGTSSLSAQESETVTGRSNVVSTNPITLVFGWFTGEYERRIGTGTTLAIGGSYFEWDDDGSDDEEYVTADLKLRYYPNERIFQGFSLGASAGFARVEEVVDVISGETNAVSGPTLGLAVDYGWLIGRRDNVHIGLGLGARRAFYGDDDESDIELDVLPYLRFSVGIAW
jgi:hypothetical protein